MKHLIILTLIFAPTYVFSQYDSTSGALQISGYMETYYAYDFGKPLSHNRPGFIYSYNRHNEVNLHLGMLKASYTKNVVRANVALMAGNYPNVNLAAEPGTLRNIFEANAGFKPGKNSNLWVDAGIFASHIGFESAIGKDCWNLTRSILADNSPYYESGVRIAYTGDAGKWYLSALLLNGWQRIQRVDGNNQPGFGHQVTYKPISAVTLNSSSFIGSDTPDSARLMRYFHNFYGIFQLNEQFGLTVGFDIGAQQESPDSSGYNTWYSPVILIRYSPLPFLTLAARGEFYKDEHGVIIATGTPNGFQTFGYSVNIDLLPAENIVWRLEARKFQSKDAVFLSEEMPVNSNFFVVTSLGVSF